MPPRPCKPLKMGCERGFDSYGSVNFKFIAIDKTLLNLCQTLAFMHGLQSMVGNLLAALMSDKDELYYGKFAKHLMAFFNIFVNQ